LALRCLSFKRPWRVLTPLNSPSPFRLQAGWGHSPARCCHQRKCVRHGRDLAKEEAWRQHLEKYYRELDISAENIPEPPLRMPFDDAMCDVLEEIKPEIVSFHFGLPDPSLLARVKAAGAKIISSATTVAEARWLEARGCDAIIAQGSEAGGHRGIFLSDDLSTQEKTKTLLAKTLLAVSIPVIAAGGIGNAKAVSEVLSHGAIAAQIGTAYLFCPEARISPVHLSSLTAKNSATEITNVYSGHPARGLMTRLMREMGPISPHAPAFPHAGRYVTPLRQRAEQQGSSDFSQMWAGESYKTGHIMPAGELTRKLAGITLE
jgi:nitronate monooxygenase